MRTPFNPYGGVNPLIDKMIGNAYDIVKYVARYLKEIRYLAENMGMIYEAVHGDKIVLTGTPIDGDDFLNLDLPEDLDVSTIIGLDAVAYTGSGEVYPPGSETFGVRISGGQVEILIGDNISELMTADYKIRITVNNG